MSVTVIIVAPSVAAMREGQFVTHAAGLGTVIAKY
jgi:hypothetical protein